MNRISLKNISINISSGLTPLRSNSDFWENGTIPWVKTEQLGVKNIYNTSEKISNIALENTSIKLNPRNTISIAMYGEGKTRGSVSILKKEMTTNQACCNIVIDDEIANYEYVYYNLKTQYYNLRNLSSGVRKNLNSGDIKNFEISIPKTIDSQNKITKVLSDLDAKIELNNKINSELESMAKLIYDYWFVQFDFPDEDGRPYKSSGGKMVYNEELKREIPDGWEVKEMNKFVTINNKKYNSQADNIPTIDLSTMPRSSMCLSSRNVSSSFTTNLFLLKKYDILFGGIRPYLLKAGFSPFDGLVTGTVHSYRPLKPQYYNFTLITFINEHIFKYAIANSKGTKMPVIGSRDLLNYKVPFNEDLIIRFNKQISFKELITNNINENHKLVELRDWLLPMLMNGQVTVK